jgi:hypothetical protein
MSRTLDPGGVAADEVVVDAPARGDGGSFRRLVAVCDALSQQLDGQAVDKSELPFGVDHDDDPRRLVGCPHRRGGLVPVLSAGAAGAASDDVDIRLGERRLGVSTWQGRATTYQFFRPARCRYGLGACQHRVPVHESANDSACSPRIRTRTDR